MFLEAFPIRSTQFHLAISFKLDPFPIAFDIAAEHEQNRRITSSAIVLFILICCLIKKTLSVRVAETIFA